MPQFDLFHKGFFDALDGSYSQVTRTEYEDSQVTLTDHEALIVRQHFGAENIQHGNVKTNPGLAAKQFFIYPDLLPVELNLVKPKLDKEELRLYLKSNVFKPQIGDVSFFFINKSNELVIGSLNQKEWELLGQRDNDDEIYQSDIEKIEDGVAVSGVNPEGNILTTISAARQIYLRDPKIALLRFQRSNYACEVDSNHLTFVSLKSEKNFVEAHHLIPMKFQSEFVIPLDSVHNVFSLCPNCHRMIHHGTPADKRFVIEKLFILRPEIAKIVDLIQLLSFYNVIH